jgi:acetylornithine aminotransferase
VLRTIAAEGLLDHAARLGKEIAAEVTALRHPLVGSVHAAGLLIGLGLNSPVAAAVATEARHAGFLINPAVPDRVRLAPPLVLTEAQAHEFITALPAILDGAQ